MLGIMDRVITVPWRPCEREVYVWSAPHCNECRDCAGAVGEQADLQMRTRNTKPASSNCLENAVI